METLLSNKKMLINFWFILFLNQSCTQCTDILVINIILHWPDCLPFISNKFSSENLVLNHTTFSTNNSFPFSSLFCLKRIDFKRESYFWLFLGDTWFIFQNFSSRQNSPPCFVARRAKSPSGRAYAAPLDAKNPSKLDLKKIFKVNNSTS